MRATTDRRPNAAGGREEEGPVPRSGSSSKVIDPDCRNGKHTACVGGPCECLCHTGADPTDPAVDISAAPALSDDTRADLALLLQPARRSA